MVIFDIVKKGFDFPCRGTGGVRLARRPGHGGAGSTARPFRFPGREIRSLQLVFPMHVPLIPDH
jgi:hypothetical protein